MSSCAQTHENPWHSWIAYRLQRSLFLSARLHNNASDDAKNYRRVYTRSQAQNTKNTTTPFLPYSVKMKVKNNMPKTGPTGIRTQVAEFKVLSDSHYTIRPISSPSTLALIRKNPASLISFFQKGENLPDSNPAEIQSNHTHSPTLQIRFSKPPNSRGSCIRCSDT